MQSQVPSIPIYANRREVIFIVVLLLAILILNLSTALIYPVVWQDEVMFTDPAANLAMGHGFVSTSWSVQPDDRLWAGNVPLHEIVLGGWIKLFGFSARAVRSINYVWFTLGTFFLWRFCVRAQLIKNTTLRLLLILLLATGSGISFSYRSGRADMIGYFLVTLALFATTTPKISVRIACLFLIGIFFPWAGLQLLPFLVMATLLALIFFGPGQALNGIVTGIGAGVGLLMLFCFYQYFGVWHDFMASVVKLGTTYYKHAQWSAIPDVFMRDRSAPLLLLLTILLMWKSWISRNDVSLKITSFALAAGLCIPLGMHFIGIFPIYYGWMAALPVTLAICQCMNLQPLTSWVKGATAVLLFSAMAIGLPIRLARAILAPPNQSYASINHFISSHLKPTDEAYVDYPAFYPAKVSAKKIFTMQYMTSAITPDEKKAINVLVVSSSTVSGMTNAIPAHWIFEAEFNASQKLNSASAPYHFVVYRKKNGNFPGK